MLATRASTATKYAMRGHKGVVCAPGINNPASSAVLYEPTASRGARPRGVCYSPLYQKVGTLDSRAISVPHTGGYATVGHGLDFRYCCTDCVSHNERPMYLIFHFENA